MGDPDRPPPTLRPMVAPADTGPEPPLGDRARPPGPVQAEESPADRRSGWRGLALAAICFLCGLFAASIAGITYAAARGLDQAEAERDLGFALATSAGLWVGFLVLPLVLARRQGGPGRFLGLSATWVDLPLGVGVGLLSTIVTALVSSAILTTRQQDDLEAKAKEVIDRASGPVAVVLLVVALCVVTPLAEEVFFRGLLFRSLRRVTWVVLAVLMAGVVFGLVHYDGGSSSGVVVAVQLGLLSLFGCALCLLVQRTGRLGASIVAHATFNAVTVISLLSQR